MGPMAYQRYGCWSAQAPPPLPVRRRGDTKTSRATSSEGVIDVMDSIGEDKPEGGETNVVPQASDNDAGPQQQQSQSTTHDAADEEPSLFYIPLSGDDYQARMAAATSAPDPHPSHPMEPSFKIGDYCSDTAALSRACRGETEVADVTVVQEAVTNPSKWILFNQETGQQLDAQAFVDAIVMLSTSTVPRCNPFDANLPESARQRPLAGALTCRRRSNSSDQPPSRPSLLPQGSGGINDSALPTRGSSRSPRPSKSPGMMTSSLPNFSTRTMHMSSNTSFGGGDGVFSLSNVQPGQVLRDVHAGGVRTMCFSPSGDYLATAGADHLALVFRVLRRRDGWSGGQPAQRIATGGLMSLLGTTPEGRPVNSSKVEQLADVPTDWTVRLVDETPFRVLSGHVGEVVTLSWAPDDSVLLTGSADGTVRCWRPRKGDECTGVFEHGGRVTSVSWDPASIPGGIRGGGRFLSGCMDGKVRIFSLDDEEAEAQVRAERPVTAVAFAPGGAAFVAGLIGGSVRFYRTEGMVQERAAECRRHGLRHSASHIKPARRLSVGTGGRSKGNGIARRKGSMGSSAAIGSSSTEERVTGICFRPQTESLSDRATGYAVESSGNEIERRFSGDCVPDLMEPTANDLPFVMSPASMHEEQNTDEHDASTGDDLLQQRRPRAPASTVPKSKTGLINGGGKEDASLWAGSMADILVSTNDSRTRVLDPGRAGGVAVRLKLKGHNSDGVQGRHIVAGYSEDGELVISGSADGYVHVWPASPAAAPTNSMRAVAWSNSREGHERMLVCTGKVAVPCAVFVPDNVAQSLGGETTRIIVAGDADGTIRVFVG